MVADQIEINAVLVKALIHPFLPTANIIEIRNGKEVIEKIKDFQIDFILMDIKMPKLEGYEASVLIHKYENEYQKNKKECPIIALTAHAFKEERHKIEKCGFERYYYHAFRFRIAGENVYWLPSTFYLLPSTFYLLPSTFFLLIPIII